MARPPRLLAISALLLLGAAPPNPQPRIVAMEARLFLEPSGELSKNILDRNGVFDGWNTIIGEGSADRAARDVIVIVKVDFARPEAESEFIDGPLIVTARTGKKLLAQRRFTSILVPYGGSAAQALYLPEVGCAGTVKLTATLGKQTRTATLHMDCGE
jgi:hypothetical protein